MDASKIYALKTNALPLGIFAYVVIALSPPPPGSLETFPFFKWSLFSTASNRKEDVVAIIRSVDGKLLSKPTLFYDMKNTFPSAAAKDSRFAKTLDRLRYAIIIKNDKIKTQTLDIINKYYMCGPKNVEYDVAIIQYNPIKRYKEKIIERTEVIGKFSKNG